MVFQVEKGRLMRILQVGDRLIRNSKPLASDSIVGDIFRFNHALVVKINPTGSFVNKLYVDKNYLDYFVLFSEDGKIYPRSDVSQGVYHGWIEEFWLLEPEVLELVEWTSRLAKVD
jgi:hypothetical protein